MKFFLRGRNSTRRQRARRTSLQRWGRRAVFESLESRRLLTSDWQNPLAFADTDDDGFVAPIDALLIINDLNQAGPRELTSNRGEEVYLDTSGDGFASPIDGLLVINLLNAGDLSHTLQLALVADTGESTTDRITRDARVAGRLVNETSGEETQNVMVRARWNLGPVFDLPIASDGRFVLEGSSEDTPDGENYLRVAATIGENLLLVSPLRFSLDTIAPAIATPRIVQADDSGLFDDDNVTRVNRPRLQTIADVGAQVRFELDGAALWEGPSSGPIEQQTVALAEGDHQIVVQAEDAAGNKTIRGPITVVIDTTPPPTPQLDLIPSSDSGDAGDQRTQNARVSLAGAAVGSEYVDVVELELRVRTSGDGSFAIPNVQLEPGDNPITVQVADLAGNQSETQRNFVRREEGAAADPVLDWQALMLETIRRDATPPPAATRALAMVSIAMLDVVRAVDGQPGYLVTLPAPQGISATAAVSAAAERIATYLYPRQTDAISQLHQATLATITEGAAKTEGLAFGRLVADAVIALRDQDGWDRFVSWSSSSQPGAWQATGPMYDEAVLPQWGDLTTFGVSDASSLRPSGPVELSSQEWADAFQEVRSLGRATGSTRTPEQTQIARFWSDGAGTETPPGHWNRIAAQFARQEQLSLGESARLFAMLNVALGDAAISAWDAKYAYNFWRPVTAIQSAALDGNDQTTADPQWTSLLITPPFPEYVSGHSTFSGAAAEILTSYFGDNRSFSTTATALPGVTRQFTSFRQAADEAGRSRIYGGIHFQFSNRDGLDLGRRVAAEVLDRFQVEEDLRPPEVVFLSAAATTTAELPTITGWVLDNLSGVESAEIRVDDGTFQTLSLDPQGRFSFQPTWSLQGSEDGWHTVAVRAQDSAGLTSREYTWVVRLDTRAPELQILSPSEGTTVTATQQLSGVVRGTGSDLVSLTYRLDSGSEMPLLFPFAGGTFQASMDVSRLSPGTHRVTVSARDAAGLATTASASFTLDQSVPLRVNDFTPSAGASEIGVTFRPQVTFSRPIDPTSLDETNFFATDVSGNRLPATIVPSRDGDFAWLFFASPLPGGSRISVHVNGSTIEAADGSLLDADGNGQPGGELSYGFTTVSRAPLSGTALVGRVVDPGDDLKPMTFDDIRSGADGILHTSDDLFLNPIAHAKVYILGMENRFVFTDQNGAFFFDSVPAGVIKLAVDGRTAANAPAGIFWPEMVMDLELETGRTNTVMGTMGTREERDANRDRREVYLPRLQQTILTPLASNQPTTITVDGKSAPDLSEAQRQYLSIEVAAGSAIGEDGRPVDNPKVGISTVPPELVRGMLPDGLMQLSATLTIQAPGVAVFNEPVALSFPNIYNAAPGTQLPFYSFDHTTGQLVITGTATVSADGKYVVTNPDDGITHPGWYGVTPQAVQQSTEVDDDGDPEEPDEPEEPVEEEEEDSSITYTVHLDGKGLIEPFLVRSKFGYELSANYFKVGPQGPSDFPLIIEDSYSWPPDGLPYEFKKTASFKVPRAVDYFIRGYLDGLQVAPIQAEIFAGLTGQVSAQYLISGTEGYRIGVARPINVAASIAPDISLNIVAGPFCDLPMGMGAFVCSQWSIPTPGFGVSIPNSLLAAVATTTFELPYPVANTFAITIGPIAQFSVLQRYQAVFTISVERSEGNGSSGESDGEGETPSVLFPPIVSRRSFNDDRRLYYRYELANGNVITGRSDEAGRFQVILPPNADYRLMVWSPRTNRYAFKEGRTGSSGRSTTTELLSLRRRAGIDSDNDGLPDIAEYIIGSRRDQADTDLDGIFDVAEIEQGLDPLRARPSSLVMLGGLPLPGEARALVVEDGPEDVGLTAFVATGSFGMAMVDVSRVQQPVLYGALDLPGEAIDMAVDPGLKMAVVATGEGGLQFVDYSQVTATSGTPRLVRTVGIDARQVEVRDGVAYATTVGELRAYDLLTGNRLDTLVLSNATLTSIAREGSSLFIVDSTRVLHAVDISDGRMVARGTLDVPGSGSLFVGGGTAYVPTGSGYATVDVRNLNSLTLISGPDSTSNAGTAVAANGSQLAVAVGTQFGSTPILQVLNDANHADTGEVLAQYNLPQAPTALVLGAGLAFVADGTAGIQIVSYRAFDDRKVPPTVTASVLNDDVALGTPGLQVAEASRLRLQVNVQDDVQVRDVELLVNGRVVARDASFPFELSSLLPTIAANGSTSITVQVRATDTGGNRGLSTPINVQLVTDQTPPALVSTNVPDGVQRGTSFRNVILRFSEPLDPILVSPANFVLTGPAGAIVPQNIQFRSEGRDIQFTYPALDAGAYTFTIRAANVLDLAGNSLGPTDNLSHFSISATNTVHWINPAGGDWRDPANWDSGVLPTEEQDVIIDLPQVGEVLIDAGIHEIRSLVSNASLTITGGTLQVAGTVRVNNDFTINGGTLKRATVLAGTGEQGIVFGNQWSTLDGVTTSANLDLRRNAGARVRIVGGLTLDHASVFVGNIDSTTGLVRFDKTQSLSGVGEFIFGQVQNFSGQNLIEFGYFENNDSRWINKEATFTIGSEIQIHGTRGKIDAGYSTIVNHGIIKADLPAPVSSGITISTLSYTNPDWHGFLVNRGELSASNGGSLSIDAEWTNATTGVINATNASLLLGSSARLWSDERSLIPWTNEGTILSIDSRVDLRGTVTTAGLGSFERVRGEVNLTGTFDNTNSALMLDGRTGSWNLKGGTLRGGMLATADGATLVFSESGATLDGLTTSANLDLRSNTKSNVTVTHGLTLQNAIVYLGDPGGTTSGELIFVDTQELGGKGTIVFGASVSNQISAARNGMTLTIGSEVVIRGVSGRLAAERKSGCCTVAATDAVIVNQGTIDLDASVGPSDFGYDNDVNYLTLDSTTQSIDLGQVTNPAPPAVYKTARIGGYDGAVFLYVFDGLEPGASFVLRLHFAELSHSAAGRRKFDVTVNGENILSQFDVFAAAGARYRGIVREFPVTADSQGRVIANFSASASSGFRPLVNGLELLENGNRIQSIDAGLTVSGNFSIVPATFQNQGTIRVRNEEAVSITGLTGELGDVSLAVTGRSLRIDGQDYVVSQALSLAAGQTLDLLGSWSNASGNTITASDGTLNLGDGYSGGDSWRNKGTISASNAVVNLGGRFHVQDLGTFQRSGGTVNLIGELDNRTLDLTLVSPTSAAKVLVPTDGSLDGRWYQPDFDDSAWQNSQAAIGFDTRTPPQFTADILTDIKAQMFGVNSTVYLRIPFQVDDPEALAGMELRLKYNDAFVAYLNGEQVVSSNYFGSAPPEWNEISNPGDGDFAYRFNFRHLLRTGQNLLAIHGLNNVANSPDFLIHPELVIGRKSAESALHLDATTGSWNLQGGAVLGGTITTADGARFDSALGGELDGVTLSTDAKMGYMTFRNGLTLNGNLILTSHAFFDGPQTLSGTGTFWLGDRSASDNTFGNVRTDSLHVAPGMTLRGGSGRFSLESVINDGTIRADDSHGELTFNKLVNHGVVVGSGDSEIYISQLENQSTIEVSDGAKLALGGHSNSSLTGYTEWSNQGTITANGATINLNGRFQQEDLGNFRRTGGTVNITGLLDNRTIDQAVVDANSTARVFVPSDDSLGDSWLSADFDDSSWVSGPASIGYDTTNDAQYADAIKTDVESLMYRRNTAIYVRISFELSERSELAGMLLQMNFDSGFAAYLNGQRIDQQNDTIYSGQWNDRASFDYPAPVTATWEVIDFAALMHPGINVLAIRGLTNQKSAPNFLLQPRLVMGLKSQETPLALDASTGSWNLAGGTIRGGRIQGADGATLLVPGTAFSSSTLDGVTLATNLAIAGGRSVYVRNGLILDQATISLESTGNGARLEFLESQRLTGTGQITLARDSVIGIGSNGFDDKPDSLTIGPGISISGAGLITTSNGRPGTLFQSGTIVSNVPGQTFTVGSSAVSVVNSGVLAAEAGATLGLVNLQPNTGTLRAAAGGTIKVTGDLEMNGSGRVELDISGTTADKIGKIEATGVAKLAGQLQVNLTGGFAPALGNTFEVLKYASRTGTFDTLLGLDVGDGKLLSPSYGATTVSLTTVAALFAEIDTSTDTRSTAGNVTETPAAAEIESIFEAAVRAWLAAGLPADLVERLPLVQLEVVDLGTTNLLAETRPGVIRLDDDAAGFGWFIDRSPEDDAEFFQGGPGTSLTTPPAGPAADRMDLLTVIMHELGHAWGLAHSDNPDDVMADTLASGKRKSITAEDVESVFAKWTE